MIDANGYLTISNKDFILELPEFSYSETTRTCYRYLVQLDFKLQGFVNWHNKKIIVKNQGVVINEIKINKWNFEDFAGSFTTTAPSNFYSKRYHKIFVDNIKCATSKLALTIENNLAVNDVFLIKDIKMTFFKCPVDCLNCKDSKSCDQCEEGKFFYPHLNKCFLPYSELKENDTAIMQVKNFLFNPKSFYLFFSKPMNFTLDTPQ